MFHNIRNAFNKHFGRANVKKKNDPAKKNQRKITKPTIFLTFLERKQ